MENYKNADNRIPGPKLCVTHVLRALTLEKC